MKKHILTIAVLGFIPFITHAQLDGSNASSLVKSITSVFNRKLIPLMILLALIYIIYAVVEYIRANDESQGKEDKKQKIFWGIIGLFVIVSVWSLVAIIANTFGIFAGGSLMK